MGINQARNEQELKQILKPTIHYAVEILMKKILELNEDAINKVVYYSTGTPRYYQNTYEFLDAWDIAVHSTKAIKTSDVQGSLFYKPSNMKTSMPPNEDNNYMGQHHGIGGKWGDSREYLAEIIYNGLAGKIYGEGDWTRPRNAYKELIKVLGKARFKKMVADSFREAGLNIKSHSASIKRTEF